MWYVRPDTLPALDLNVVTAMLRRLAAHTDCSLTFEFVNTVQNTTESNFAIPINSSIPEQFAANVAPSLADKFAFKNADHIEDEFDVTTE